MSRTTAPKKKLESMNLTELRARYREVVGEETRSPNKKFLIRRIEESLAAKKRRSPSRRATATAPSAPPAPAAQPPTSVEGTQSANQRGRFAGMSLEALQAKYREVVGRPTGSSDIPYVEPVDMWSCVSARRVLPRSATRMTPHNRAAFSGGITLRFLRPEACMATGAASWRSQGERA
ncbi:hypothetical protein [Myxococcus sp. AS-1-15]|uniref:hypothetical protein n=1 Tax=Myxococcus sp. AS-1-15 TaxID=2874600 RepID=UPI001CBEABF6|nr:hypothetical protein [Myxococcus sp. AS-1-15]